MTAMLEHEVRHRIDNRRGVWQPLLVELGRLFEQMDEAYHHTAAACGFVCRGCADNCCRSHFHHHTLLEYLYLRQGCFNGGSRLRPRIITRLNAAPAPGDRRTSNRMCPLNENERCTLYDHRPMICRLHGVAWEVRGPGQSITGGPGCALFTQQSMDRRCRPLDRTPFYQALAALEGRLRTGLGLNLRIKMTVAEMLKTFADDGRV